MNGLAWAAVLASPLLSAIIAIIGIAASRQQNKASAEKTTTDASKIVHGMALEQLDYMQKQIDQVRAENTYLAAEITNVRSRLDDVEDDRDVLADAISVHASWEDAGRKDPPGAPAIPDRVRRILARLNTTPA